MWTPAELVFFSHFLKCLAMKYNFHSCNFMISSWSNNDLHFFCECPSTQPKMESNLKIYENVTHFTLPIHFSQLVFQSMLWKCCKRTSLFNTKAWEDIKASIQICIFAMRFYWLKIKNDFRSLSIRLDDCLQVKYTFNFYILFHKND